LPHLSAAQAVPARQQGHHRGEPRTEWPPRHPGWQKATDPATTGGTAPDRRLVLGHPHCQRQQFHDLVTPRSTPDPSGSFEEWLPTMAALLWHHGHDLVHLFDRQQRPERPRCPGCPPRFRPEGGAFGRAAAWGGSDEGAREELEEDWPSRASNSRLRSRKVRISVWAADKGAAQISGDRGGLIRSMNWGRRSHGPSCTPGLQAGLNAYAQSIAARPDARHYPPVGVRGIGERSGVWQAPGPRGHHSNHSPIASCGTSKSTSPRSHSPLARVAPTSGGRVYWPGGAGL